MRHQDHQALEAGPPGRRRDRADASALGADSSWRKRVRSVPAHVPDSVRIGSEPVAVQVLQRAVQGTGRRNAQVVVGRTPASSRSKCIAVAFWRNRGTLAGRRRALVYVARCSLVPAQLAPERAEMVEAARHQGREPDAGLFLRLVELHRQIHIADIERAAGVGAEDQLKTETLWRKATSASARAPSASSLSPAGSCWRRSRSGASSERSRS